MSSPTIGPANGASSLLLVAHYDSTPTGPGAADDGIGVAAMLEVAPTCCGAALQRPVSFLFDEGEEIGLIGARGVLSTTIRWRRASTALINIESRGVEGPAIMFETSRPNGAAIGRFAAGPAVRSPIR